MLPIKSAKAVVTVTMVQETGAEITFAEEINIPIEAFVTRDDCLPAYVSCIDAFKKSLGETPRYIRMANDYYESRGSGKVSHGSAGEPGPVANPDKQHPK